MIPGISVITLGVADMERAVRFYRDGLGLVAREDKPPVVYFELAGTWLAVFPREHLARYIGVSPEGSGFAGMTLSCNLPSTTEVDRVMATAQEAGATMVRAAAEYSWGGYVGWFADPDGHLWEVVFNPRPFLPQPS